jgi:hypothetical protein
MSSESSLEKCWLSKGVSPHLKSEPACQLVSTRKHNERTAVVITIANEDDGAAHALRAIDFETYGGILDNLQANNPATNFQR